MEHPLKTARMRYNLTQQQLATNVGISARTISTAESGGHIGLDARRRLCKYFKMSAKDLKLSDSDQEQSNPASDTVVVTFSKQGDTVVVQFDESKRATLQSLLTFIGAGTAFIGSGMLPARTDTGIKLDLEVIENYVDSLSQLIMSGGAKYVVKQSSKLYDTLAQQYPDDPYISTVQLKVGMLLAAAQEYTLPWY